MNLFEPRTKAKPPLAERMRPKRLSEVVGQRHLLGPGKLLTRAIEQDRVPSLVFWGPPGTGKTTLAQVVAHETQGGFIPFSAVLGGVPELRRLIADVKAQRGGLRTYLFVDEIHRFNKAQQDALLPHVEDGTVTLLGATTENPSFSVNAALLSRARVFRLELLAAPELVSLLERALVEPERGLGQLQLHPDREALEAIADRSGGDARRALDALELAAEHAAGMGHPLDRDVVHEALSQKPLLYDKSGEEHFNVVSALIKSLRGSDPDAGLYWMMRMIESGDDPLFVLRRLLIFASEDIGNADPRALQLAVATDAAFRRLGLPEGLMAMGQLVTYLASAPKSDASYRAWTAAQRDVREHGSLPVPLHLRNAPTSAMKAWGYGRGYRNPHQEKGSFAAGATYLPEELTGRRYYEPKESGLEAKIRDRLRRLRGEDWRSED